MVIKFNYELTVPKEFNFIINNPVSSSLKGIQSKIDSLSTNGSLSSQFISIGFGNWKICQKIKELWLEFCRTIRSFFESAYRWVTCNPSRTYPIINMNFSPEQLLKLYWGLGKDEKWRECIDARYHHLNDKYCFDKGTHGGTVEPGFISSMEETFTFVQNYLNKRIDADWYLELHKHTAAHFKGSENGTLMGQEKVGVFRNSDDYIHAGFSGQYFPRPEAIAELNALNASLQTEFGDSYKLGEFIYTNDAKTDMRLNYHAMSRSQVRTIFDKFLNEYYKEIAEAATADQKLWAIAKLQQRLEWLHPVRDGTARTTTALLNKHLTDNGFHPALLEYPHVSSSYGLADWKNYLQDGLIKWENTRDRYNPASTC